MVEPNDGSSSRPKQLRCPTCRARVEWGLDSFPFCSTRCRDVDLGQWFEESFRIPSDIVTDDDEESDPVEPREPSP